MKLEEIYEAWSQDSVFERDLLTEESIKIPQLHSKYLKMLSTERMRSKAVQQEYKTLFRIKHEYYRGDLDHETLINRGWEPFDLKIVRQDLDMYLQSDEDIQQAQAKVDVQKEKISLLESIIQQINNRGFQIKGVIDWEKFKAGL